MSRSASLVVLAVALLLLVVLNDGADARSLWGLPNPVPAPTTTTNNRGIKIESHAGIRKLFSDVRTTAPTGSCGSTAVLDDDVKLRFVSIGDFTGASTVQQALFGPFVKKGYLSGYGALFSGVTNVYELWNIQAGNRVQFIYAVEGNLQTTVPTTGVSRVNITYHGNAKLAADGTVTHLFVNPLNLAETIIASGSDAERNQLLDFICTNQMKCSWWLFGGSGYVTKSACVTALSLTKLGKWASIGKTNSLICRAWFSSIITSSSQSWCAAVRALPNDFCKDEVVDVQWANVGDFYDVPTANIPRLLRKDELPVFQAWTTPKTTCDAACQQQLQVSVQTLYAHTLWPTAAEVMYGTTQFADLFATNSFGRITPAGTFDDAETNREYFSGLVSANQSRASTGWMLLNKANANFQVLVHVVIQLDAQPATSETPIPRPAANMSEMIVFQFDSYGRIASYDGALSELGSTEDPSAILKRTLAAYPFLGNVLAGITDGYLNSAAIGTVCNTVVYLCTGANQQWTSVDACAADLSTRRFGSWDDASRHDNIPCRMLHLLLIPHRPDVHCFHAGPAGGGKCVDHVPSSWNDWQFLAARNVVV